MTASSTHKLKSAHSQSKYNYNMAAVDEVILAGIGQGVFPGATLLVKIEDQIVYRQSFGSFFPEDHTDSNPQVIPETVYDLGNMSSIVATIPVLMVLIAKGLVSLDNQVIRFLQSFSVNGKASVTIGDLVFHLSGLGSKQNFLEDLIKENTNESLGIINSPAAKEYVCNRINRSQLKYEPQEMQQYSDLGLILLGKIIEDITGMRLDQVAKQEVFNLLGMGSTGFVNHNHLRCGLAISKEIVAPTENCSWRKKILWGEVMDDTAWSFGGVAGHAGVFSDIDDLSKLTQQFLRSYHSRSDFFPRSILSQFWDLGQETTGLQYLGGWEVPHKNNSMLDVGLSSRAIGFNSNTGCMLWLEPERNLEIIFLSNSTYPSRSNKKIQAFRPLLVETVLNII